MIFLALELMIGISISAFVLFPSSLPLGSGPMQFVWSRVFLIALVRLLCLVFG